MKKLWTTKAVLEEIWTRYNCSNNNQLAKKMGVGASATLAWSRGAVMEKREHIEHAAKLIEEDEGWLALCLAVESQKSAILAEKMRDALLAGANRVAVALLAFGMMTFSYSGQLNLT